MIELALAQLLAIVYDNPGFFTIQYWLWPFFYMGAGVAIVGTPAVIFECSAHDTLMAMLLGMSVGLTAGLLAGIVPFYLLVLVIVGMIFYMVVG